MEQPREDLGRSTVGSDDWLVAVYPRLLEDLRRGGCRVDLVGDAAQHAVLRALHIRNVKGWDFLGSHPWPYGWLLTTAWNYVKDEARKECRRRPLSSREIDELPDAGAELIKTSREVVEAVQEALKALPERERQIVDQRRLEGKKLKEIGAVEFGEHTPGSRISKAFRMLRMAEARLRDLLRDWADDEAA